MKYLLDEALRIAALRGVSAISHEDILFLMRKNKIKLRRMLKYLEVKDLKANITSYNKETEEITSVVPDDENATEAPVEENNATDLPIDENATIAEAKIKQVKVTRIEKCQNFLNFIDMEELGCVFKDSEIYDDEKHERLQRQNRLTLNMDAEEYLDFHNARQAGFHENCVFKHSKFKHWLYLENEDPVRLSMLAFEMICYLAHETVATIVSSCMKMKEDKMKKGIEKPRMPSLTDEEKINLRYSLFSQKICDYIILSQLAKSRVPDEDLNDEDSRDCITPAEILEVVSSIYKFKRPTSMEFMNPTLNKSPPKLICL